MQLHNQTDEERKEPYFRYVEIGLHNTLLQMCDASIISSQSPEYDKLRNLLPVEMIYAFYDLNTPFIFINPITGKEYSEKCEKEEESRINAIRKINQLIEEHNEEVEKYNSVTPFEKRDIGKYKKEYLIWEWGLNAMLSKPVNREPSGENVLGLVHWNNEFLYQKALRIENQDEYVPFLNKLIYDYLILMTPVENREEHIFHQPLLEFENWFLQRGYSIEHTPNLFDIGDGKILTNPLAQKLQDTKKEKENINQEHSNLIKIYKKMKKEHKREIQLVSSKAPEQRFIDMVNNNTLDKRIKEEGLNHKSSGAINWTGLARMIGLRDGKTAKKYAEKYAPYLLRDDEEGYTI